MILYFFKKYKFYLLLYFCCILNIKYFIVNKSLKTFNKNFCLNFEKKESYLQKQIVNKEISKTSFILIN